MMSQYPWELKSDLVEERLIKLANYIAKVRDEVIDLHDEELGDTRLALGMRAYECCRTRLIKISKNESFPWLSILDAEGRFTFCLGSTPVRFSRNDPKYLPDRKLIVSTKAMEQLSLFGEQSNAAIRWFFVFDTDYKSAADAVYFVGYNETGEIICQWQIPIEDRVTIISDATKPIPEAVEIEKPKVGIKRRQSISQKNE